MCLCPWPNREPGGRRYPVDQEPVRLPAATIYGDGAGGTQQVAARRARDHAQRISESPRLRNIMDLRTPKRDRLATW